MCIRDRQLLVRELARCGPCRRGDGDPGNDEKGGTVERATSCLLYTSDAADERSSVDLGGRRIIKKKNKLQTSAATHITQHTSKKIKLTLNSRV